MTLPLVNTWGAGGEVTSAQMNALAAAIVNALDNRAGQTATLGSVVSASGAGRLIPTFVSGADAPTTYQAGGGNQCINASTGLTANRAYTLGATGAVTGDSITILGHTTRDITVVDGPSSITLFTISAGSPGNWAEFKWMGTNWILWASSGSATYARTIITASGNYTVPAGIFRLWVFGIGGGGGGGAGGSADVDATTSTHACCGGGGGGAAQASWHVIETTPGTVFAVTVATAAAGGAGVGGISQQGGAGTDGGDLTFGSTLTFYGAQGGTGGTGSVVQALMFTPGGGPHRSGYKNPYSVSMPSLTPSGTGSLANMQPVFPRYPGEGGFGGSHAGSTGTAGFIGTAGVGPSMSGTTGGAGNTVGGAVGGFGAQSAAGRRGGAPGGGGGGSVFGSGGAGGTGPQGSDGAAVAGGAGSAAGGPGAGGGGSSSAAWGASGSAAGGAGGAGGSPVVIVYPTR